MKQKDERCGVCLFFKDESDMEEKGICRRFPPAKGEQFPIVLKTGWCGEYKRC